MNDDAILEMLTTLSARSIRLEARCDALAQVLCALAVRHGIEMETIASAIERATARCHQKRLERIEDRNPSVAADLDLREPGSDLGL